MGDSIERIQLPSDYNNQWTEKMDYFSFSILLFVMTLGISILLIFFSGDHFIEKIFGFFFLILTIFILTQLFPYVPKESHMLHRHVNLPNDLPNSQLAREVEHALLSHHITYNKLGNGKDYVYVGKPFLLVRYFCTQIFELIQDEIQIRLRYNEIFIGKINESNREFIEGLARMLDTSLYEEEQKYIEKLIVDNDGE